MTERQIYILSGPIRSGKTTRLQNWADEKSNVFGILSPVIEGKRNFLDIHTKEVFGMAATDEEREVLTVGKYIFSKAAFNRASTILHGALTNNEGWLILDEAGPLELKQQGFYEEIKNILRQEKPNLKIVFIVRDSMLDEFLRFFKITAYSDFSF